MPVVLKMRHEEDIFDALVNDAVISFYLHERGVPVCKPVDYVTCDVDTYECHIFVVEELQSVSSDMWKDYHTFRTIMTQAARALASAQASGIIHHDVKPEHIMLDKQACEQEHQIVVKLIDFDLAVAMQPLLPALKCDHSRRIPGTSKYNPGRYEPCGPHVDVYQWGKTVSSIAKFYSHKLDEPLATLCTKAIARNWTDRPSMADIASLLEAAYTVRLFHHHSK
jgi:serine/threonine protein kinase